MLRIEVEEFSTPRASLEKPRRSISSSLPSLVMVNGFSRKSFSYSKLPEEPIKLSVLKLDGSSFDVEVIKSATIAELKLAVQDVFSHMPTKGPGKISWPHVWGHFCLCYGGWKLVTDTDIIINYGITDGDQLRFIRHISPIFNMTKIQSKRRIVARKQSYLSISSSASSLGSEQNDEEDDEYDDMENGRYQTHKDESPSIVVEQECQFGHLWRESTAASSICVAKNGIALCKNFTPNLHTKDPIFQFVTHHPTFLQSNTHHHLPSFTKPETTTPKAMASMIMASSKSIVPVTSSSLPSKPKLQQIQQLFLPKIPTPKFLKSQQILSFSSSTLKSISLLTATSLSFAPPSLAEEMEKAALFDFNLTLPIMMVQFLLLMFALDKIYFTPLGKFMDERDAAIKEKLASVKDTSEEVKGLEEQATAIMRAARAEISAALNKMKKETQLELEEKLAEGRKKVEAELQEALANLEKQKEGTIKSLDSQISALSQEIVKKVLPL
ncbi:uncharacterized protein LOC110410724 [Herrania umbratica]|uniref:Uncharacterized protein LOC110410724 n=1 Tax=Herrania umbratica TaxID=108875 RepID=A0A6J0ZN24_9ROSI|nr:uncharacterized protein LOC110410724 [Herrania umbratica]